MGKKNAEQTVQVKVCFGGPTSPTHPPRTQNMKPELAALWDNGGVVVQRFTDLGDPYKQWDALTNTWIVGAMRSTPTSNHAIAEWQGLADSSGVYTHSLPSDFPLCPTTGLPAVAYNP